MGIKRFHAWLMSQNFPKKITLADDGRSHKQLVVDGWNLVYQMAESDKTWTTGDTMFSNWNKIFTGVTKLTELFRRFSIELVFFLDSWYEPSKLSEKKSRIAQQIVKHEALVPLFQSSDDAHAVCASCLDTLANNSFGWSFEFVHALRAAGCAAYFTRGDADIAIAQYVKIHQDVVFGIFSTDTDFLAFNFDENVVIIRDLASIQVKQGKMIIRYWRPVDIWNRLGLSESQKLRFIAFMGNDFVRGAARNIRIAVSKARHPRCKVSKPIIAAMTRMYQINLDSAGKWTEQIAGRSKMEAFVMELKTNHRMQFQCEIGDDKVSAAPRLLRPLRQHLYHVLGIPRVEEVMFLPPHANGKSEFVQAEKSETIATIFDQVLELKDPGLDELVSVACDALTVISPYDCGKTRFFCRMLDAQYKIVAKFPAVFDKFQPRVQQFVKTHAPLAEHLTLAHMFKRVVLITHVLVGQQEMASISEWFYPPLLHFGLQKIGEFNDVLSKMDCEGLGPVGIFGNPRANMISCRKCKSHPKHSACITPSSRAARRARKTRAGSGKKPGNRPRSDTKAPVPSSSKKSGNRQSSDGKPQVQPSSGEKPGKRGKLGKKSKKSSSSDGKSKSQRRGAKRKSRPRDRVVNPMKLSLPRFPGDKPGSLPRTRGWNLPSYTADEYPSDIPFEEARVPSRSSFRRFRKGRVSGYSDGYCQHIENRLMGVYEKRSQKIAEARESKHFMDEYV